MTLIGTKSTPSLAQHKTMKSNTVTVTSHVEIIVHLLLLCIMHSESPLSSTDSDALVASPGDSPTVAAQVETKSHIALSVFTSYQPLKAQDSY